MRDHIEIGATPHEEDCAQVGSEGYAKRARHECELFAKQIIKHYGEPEYGYLTIKGHAHDFGTYYEVRACYDDEDEESTKWAFDIEGDSKGVLATWDAEFHPINDVFTRSKQMKTSELKHDGLVAAVAMCLGYTNLHKIEGRWKHEPQFAMTPPNPLYGVMELWEIGSDCDWEWFGPIIEREGMNLFRHAEGSWSADNTRADVETHGPTPLVAAMRCYVASKLGDDVEIPEELK